MNDRQRLRELVNLLPDNQVQSAIALLERLEDNDPLSPEELANLESGFEDVGSGRMVLLEDYERESSSP